MLPLITVREILAHIKYKPGWSVELYETMSLPSHYMVATNTLSASHVSLKISFPAKDRETDFHITLHTVLSIPLYITEKDFVTIVFGMLKDCEMHECGEMFTYKGFRVFDPHLSERNWPPK